MLNDKQASVNVQNIHHVKIRPDVDLQKTIQYDDRQRFVAIPSTNPQHVTGVIGSTYTSTVTKHQEELQLDAIYCDYLHDHRQTTGLVIAIGDGRGGHIAQEDDQLIAAAAAIATQCAGITLANTEIRHNQLTELAQTICKQACTESQNYARRLNPSAIAGSTTLAAAKIECKDHRFYFSGFNVGDCLIAAYHPQTQRIIPLLNARQSYGMGGQGTPAIEQRLNAYEIVTQQCELPDGCLLLTMTDGCYEDLAISIDGEQKNLTDRRNIVCDYRYLEQRLDEQKIIALFSTLADSDPVERYRDRLMQAIVAKSENKRITCDRTEFQRIGDDVALSIVRISHVAFSAAFEHCVAPTLVPKSTAASEGLRRSGHFATTAPDTPTPAVPRAKRCALM
jgi:hypothetical protein